MTPGKPQSYKYLFGPVNSRRYGLSLGVDLALPKTCSLNCIFCQIGETSQTTTARGELPLIADVISELNEWISTGGKTDFITVAGSGEPTLHKNFGDILRYINNESAFRSLLLTNGSLFSLEAVRSQAALADVVKISLHAWDQCSFQQITRADPSLSFNAIIDGYRRFRNIYTGSIDLEIFVIPGINDKPEQMKKIAAIACSFQPDSIYLNSAVRPPADASVRTASPALLKELSSMFGDLATSRFKSVNPATLKYSTASLVELISRHPASLHQLAEQFNLPHDVMRRELLQLEQKKVLKLSQISGELFALPLKK